MIMYMMDGAGELYLFEASIVKGTGHDLAYLSGMQRDTFGR